MKEKPVYSTEIGSQPKNTNKKSNFVCGSGPCKMRLEKRNGGRLVTVLYNLPFEESEAKSIMRQMQSQFGCGATIKNSTIELQGDVRSRVEEFCSKQGIKIVQ